MELENPADKNIKDELELDNGDFDKPEPDKKFEIQIDRVTYTVTENRLTGADLRRIPDPPIPPERDLFEIIPGHPDHKVENEDRILIVDGLRFFTAPNTINPGSHTASQLRRNRQA